MPELYQLDGEPKLKLAICNLYKGKVGKALDWICQPIERHVNVYKSSPDPIEWAYLIICVLAKGSLNEAIVRASQYSSLSHPELDRTRTIIQYLQDQNRDKVFAQNNPSIKYRRSIHQMPVLSFEEWVNNVILMLTACNQIKYAVILSNLFAPQQESLQNDKDKSGNIEKVSNNYLRTAWIYSTERINRAFYKILYNSETATGLPPIFLSDYMIRLARYLKLNLVIRRLLQLKNTVTSFNPSLTEKAQENELDNSVQNIFEKEQPATILIIGSCAIDCLRKKLTPKKPQEPVVKFIYLDLDILNNQFPFSHLKSYEFTPASLNSFSRDLNGCIRKLKEENAIEQFDMVCLDNAWLFQNEQIEELENTKFLIMSRWSAENNSKSRQEFINEGSYQLLSQQLSNENGYAIFKNR